MKNIFIEGIQGAGKSTLVQRLSEALPAYRTYREGDLSPVDLAWCSYMTEDQFEAILKKYEPFRDEMIQYTAQESDRRITAYTRILTDTPAFYSEMESFEIYNGRVPFEQFREIVFGRYEAFSSDGYIFECAFFQNTIETMMLFYQLPNEAIMRFYEAAYALLKGKHFKMLYLDSQDIRSDILKIKAERADVNGMEMWFPLMMSYLKASPYGETHQCSTLDDLVAHLTRRRHLEKEIIKSILGEDAVVLRAKEYEMQAVLDALV